MNAKEMIIANLRRIADDAEEGMHEEDVFAEIQMMYWGIQEIKERREEKCSTESTSKRSAAVYQS